MVVSSEHIYNFLITFLCEGTCHLGADISAACTRTSEQLFVK
jgi:hypothetical protein